MESNSSNQRIHYLVPGRRDRALLAVNLGTGTPERGSGPCGDIGNVESGTRWSDLRRQHGVDNPYNVKYWCLGNKWMAHGNWGTCPPKNTASRPETLLANAHRGPLDLRLIACGSSEVGMPTYLEWDRQTLEECYDDVDAISLHHYFGNGPETGGDSAKFLGRELDDGPANRGDHSPCVIWCAAARNAKSSFGSPSTSGMSVSPQHRSRHERPAKRGAPSCRRMYNLEDALVVGGLIISLLRHSDRVRLACLAQLVNDIAPLVTNADGVLRQTIYYPYAWVLKYGRGNVPQSDGGIGGL